MFHVKHYILMKKILMVCIVVFVTVLGCIPLNNVHKIDTYEIKEGKPKSRKDAKKYTRYIYTNDSPHQIVMKFLEDKYKDKSFNGWYYVTTKKLFLDENIEFRLSFALYTKQQRYLDLYNLFSNKSSNDPYYNEELDDPYQDGERIRYVAITVTDDSGVDYLAKNSALRDRLIVYLKSVKREYEVYKRNYYFINGK